VEGRSASAHAVVVRQGRKRGEEDKGTAQTEEGIV